MKTGAVSTALLTFQPLPTPTLTAELVVIEPPVGPDGASAGRDYSESGWIYAVSQKAIDEGKGEAIARLFEWLGSDGYYLTAYGPEGECWSRGENDIIQQNEDDSCRRQRALASWAYKGSDEEYRSRYETVTEQSNGQTVDVGQILERSYEYPRTETTQFAVIPPASPVVAADMQRFTSPKTSCSSFSVKSRSMSGKTTWRP